MGKTTVRVAGNRGISGYIKTLDAESREIFFQAIDEIGEIGAQEMRRIIKKRTSKYSRSGIKAKLGFPEKGRIRTGKMLDSIGHRPRRGQNLYQAEVGYLNDYQEYFKWQEIGFTNIWKFFGESNRPYASAPNAPAGWAFRRLTSGAPKVKGIFALRDARQKMVDSIPDVLKRADSRVNRRLNKI
jgi:hypothetical protein